MLKIERLSAQIEGIEVLRHADLEMPQGSTIALIGRNGAGKTSLLRSIMGFMKITAGQVTLDGNSLAQVPPHRRPYLGIGYAPEDRRLYGAFTLEQNLRFPAEVMRLPETEIARRLERVYGVLPELKDMRERPAAGLSGGQGKMVALGRALMAGDRIILLDEPFQGLAPVLAIRYGTALRALRDADRDITLLITESNPSLLRAFADRIYVIERGEVSTLDSLPESSLAEAGLGGH
ncbi:ATP-binding cassette domain-containing protein [Xanthobacter sp. DSM 24535]|uniref:ABC transporter ATP-binding protein n=1 Tax=Roseixanthobacter psychrophilus TaxID=3119917 RepID=UPI0037277798